jgi:hypothetical protein
VPLGGKWRSLVGNIGEWCVKSRHLQGCSFRLCRLRTDGLGPVSKYWTYRSDACVYGPSKPSSLSSTDACLCPHCFNGWLERETGYGPTDRSADVLWIMLWAVALLNSVDDYAKSCYMWITWDTYGRGLYTDQALKACGVLVKVFPYMMYIDSNRRNSRIWVTTCLWQSAHR